MYHNLVKQLHYMWLFLNIRGYSSQITFVVQNFPKGQEVLAEYMCFADIIYGINVEKLGFPISAGFYLVGTVGNQPSFLALLLNDALHLCFVGIFLKIQEILFKIHIHLQSFGLMRELFEFSHKAGSFIWWSVRIF